jgi:hypothetical protein
MPVRVVVGRARHREATGRVVGHGGELGRRERGRVHIALGHAPDYRPNAVTPRPPGQATHKVPLGEAPQMYETFQKKEDGAIKILLKP